MLFGVCLGERLVFFDDLAVHDVLVRRSVRRVRQGQAGEVLPEPLGHRKVRREGEPAGDGGPDEGMAFETVAAKDRVVILTPR